MSAESPMQCVLFDDNGHTCSLVSPSVGIPVRGTSRGSDIICRLGSRPQGGPLTFFLMARQYAQSFRGVSSMWKHNFMFRQEDSKPLDQSENDLYNDTEPALDKS